MALAACSVAGVSSPLPSATLDPSQLELLSPSPHPTVEPTATPLPTAMMTASPDPLSPSPTLGATSPESSHADLALEAVLPGRIGDAKLTRYSVAGTSFSGGGDVCSLVCPDEPRLMAESVGATRDELTVAYAFEERDDHFGRYVLVAFRVRGVTGPQLRQGRISMYQADPPYPIVGDKVVAGRTVTVAITWWAPNDTEYMVVTDDALILIRSPSPEDTTGTIVVPSLVATVVAALP
jgi:hypothetical protein